MSKERTDLGFGEALDDFNPAEWTPKPVKAANDRQAKAATAKAAEAAGFKSREAKAGVAAPVEAAPSAPEPVRAGQGAQLPSAPPEALQQRRRRTGRNTQFNLKTRPETIEAYCALADRMGWGLGETLERAVVLLEAKYGVASR